MKDKLEGRSIRYSIFSYFTVTALVMGILIALFLNTRFSNQLSASMETEGSSRKFLAASCRPRSGWELTV